MNRAERRARARRGSRNEGDPLQAVEAGGAAFGSQLQAFDRTMAEVMAKWAAGAATLAEVAAVDRWAAPAGVALVRAADDLARLNARLRQAAGLEPR